MLMMVLDDSNHKYQRTILVNHYNQQNKCRKLGNHLDLSVEDNYLLNVYVRIEDKQEKLEYKISNLNNNKIVYTEPPTSKQTS